MYYYIYLESMENLNETHWDYLKKQYVNIRSNQFKKTDYPAIRFNKTTGEINYWATHIIYTNPYEDITMKSEDFINVLEVSLISMDLASEVLLDTLKKYKPLKTS